MNVSANWAKAGAEIPHGIVGALRVRSLTITEMSCEKSDVGAGRRTYAGTSAERVPFTLIIDKKTAPMGTCKAITLPPSAWMVAIHRADQRPAVIS